MYNNVGEIGGGERATKVDKKGIRRENSEKNVNRNRTVASMGQFHFMSYEFASFGAPNPIIDLSITTFRTIHFLLFSIR